jgi:putative ABC transport system substrate-binding protein
MKRRAFMALLGGAAAYPIYARSQTGKVVKIGFVTWGSPAVGMRLDDLRKGLREFGYIEGENLELESHFTDGNRDRTREVIQSLVKKPVDVLVVWQTPAVHIAKDEAGAIPIVMMVADALATGIVSSLSRPGGNITGVSNTGPDLAGKRLEVLREIRPGLRMIAFLGSSSDPNGPTFARETKASAKVFGLGVAERFVDNPGAINEALFQSMKGEGVEAVIVQPVFTSYRKQVVELAMKYQMPVSSDFALYAEAGALFSLGVDDGIQLRRTAYFVDRILKGAKPADIPVEQPTAYQLVVNQQTATKLGWSLPPSLLARADRVIE